jgi:pimeloyl-ACP methyl ester carboxylesterase
LLLIMGATASMLWWPDAFCQQLADKGLFVIRYDNRDTGRSTAYPPPEPHPGAPGRPPYTLDDMADDALAILDAHGLAAAHLVGLSLGGMIAQLVALKSPARVRTLTAISSCAFDEDDPTLPPMAPAFMTHFATLARLDWTDRAAIAAFHVESARLSANDDAHFDRAQAQSLAEREFDRASSPRSAMNHGALTGGEGWKGRLPDLSLPALVIHGAKDPILSLQAGRNLAAALHAQLIVLPRGHELHPADWPQITAAIAALTGPPPP